jgi:SAM-dependent methyltransferase
MPTNNADDLLNLLQAIVLRIPQRAGTKYHRDILAKLNEWRAAENDHSAATFTNTWEGLKEKLLSTPQFFYFIFRKLAENESGLLDLIKRQHFERGIVNDPPFYQTDLGWVEVQADDGNPRSMLSQVLYFLANTDYKKGTPYEFFSIYFTFIDLMHSHFIRPEIKPVQEAIYELLFLQALNWPKAYCAGNAYQGSDRLGIAGGKPNEVRMQQYEIDSLLDHTQNVLDIGSNMGFMSLYLAERCKRVDALEYNPYLSQIGQTAASALAIENASFRCGDFFLFRPRDKYDVVLSLANHATIDNRLSVSFEDYIQKIYSLLHDGGYFFFESHNVFGPGKGGAGDDGDLDAKFDIAARYFDVLKYRMTASYIPDHDVDKLFVVMKKKSRIEPQAKRTITRADAIRKYHY